MRKIRIEIPEYLAMKVEKKNGQPIEKCVKDAIIERLFPGETLSTNA